MQISTGAAFRAPFKILSGKRVMKELWCKVSTILPRKGVVTNDKLTKIVHVLERLKSRTVKFMREIDLSARTIIKSEPHSVAPEVFGFFNMKDHALTPMEKSG